MEIHQSSSLNSHMIKTFLDEISDHIVLDEARDEGINRITPYYGGSHQN